MIFAMTTAALIREARAFAGLTQAQVAAGAGLAQPQVSDYERGRHEPTGAILRRVLAACGRRLDTAPARPDPAVIAARLSEVLDLAASMPTRPRGTLRFPRLPASPGNRP